MNILIKKKPCELITPESINFTELVRNSNTTLSLSDEYQSNMIKILNEEFSEQQQQWFIANLYIYMHYHPTNDYPINLENVFHMIGFANKGNAKRTLENNFTKEEDYKITILPSEKGQIAREDIMLNVDTFKSLCMLAKTDKGKEIRKYYVKLENIHNKIIKEEIEEQKLLKEKIQLQLDNKQYLLEQKQIELDNEKKNKNWLLNRRYNNSKPGDTIYLYKDYKDDAGKEFIYKIGKTKNISERETEYSNTSKSGKIVYIQYCLNCDLTEKLLHHILDKYRLVKNQEWFNFTEELAIQTIKSIIYIMDSQMEHVEEFIPKLHNLLEIPNIEYIKEIKVENRHVDINIKNPLNFDLFIEECCEILERMNTPKTYIKDAHRIWSKNSTKETISALDIYLNNKFKSTVIIDENGVSRNMFKDVKLKPLIYTISDKNLDYEQFITNQISIGEMKVDWKARITYLDFFNYFIEWKRINEPHYKLKHFYKKEIQVYLEQKFAGGRVYESGGSKTKHLNGLWGVGAKKTNFGLKNPDRTNKKVGQYTIENVLIKQWDSLSIASRELNMRIATLSKYARFKTIKNGMYYKYE